MNPHPAAASRPGRIRKAGLLLCAAASAITLTGWVAPAAGVESPARAAADRTFHGTVSEALATLRVRAEHTTGYDRDSYRHWISQGDGCDTRDVVLIDENRKPSAVGPDCTYTGRWYSYYDKVFTTDPGTFDIDHLVALGEADPSGAYRWTAGTKERYANDLGDPRTLVAVTASVNRSKSDQDPSEWQPAHGKCRYIASWVAIKVRWHLRVDRAEKRAIARRIGLCPTRTITVTRAHIHRTPSQTSGRPDATGVASGHTEDDVLQLAQRPDAIAGP